VRKASFQGQLGLIFRTRSRAHSLRGTDAAGLHDGVLAVGGVNVLGLVAPD
jgi:hypothetical protein